MSCIAVDALKIPKTVKLIKIDVEGQELSTLKGMKQLLKRDHPILIVEGNEEEVASYLDDLGYKSDHLDGSHNKLFFPIKNNAQ